MKIHPLARIAALGLILLALGTATLFAGPEKDRSGSAFDAKPEPIYKGEPRAQRVF
jgi:hypothetical protein